MGVIGWLRKRTSRLTFRAAAARKNCSRTNFIRRKRRRRSPITFLSSANIASTFFRSRCALANAGVSVEKVPQLMLVAVQGSRYKQARVPDGAVYLHIRRPAAHDGTPFPRGVAVLLLPPRRSGS